MRGFRFGNYAARRMRWYTSEQGKRGRWPWLSTMSNDVALWCNWLTRRPLKAKSSGSSPDNATKPLLKPQSCCDRSLLAWLGAVLTDGDISLREEIDQNQGHEDDAELYERICRAEAFQWSARVSSELIESLLEAVSADPTKCLELPFCSCSIPGSGRGGGSAFELIGV